MFEHVRVLRRPLRVSHASEVDRLEAKHGWFPTGYREYVTELGEGVLGGTFIRVYPPSRILEGTNSVDEWRARIADQWFWDDGRDVLAKPRALECVILGDTLGGDELCVHPSTPERIYVLPRNHDTIFIAGDGLVAAIEWLCSSGTLTTAFAERDFDPL